ncbi:MAG: translation initiation factor 2 [Xanthobacteraceae bacterium]|jgi:hypothetical protein|nr:translation initiation factor 2 [Xanthobacteraceae bacterium]
MNVSFVSQSPFLLDGDAYGAPGPANGPERGKPMLKRGCWIAALAVIVGACATVTRGTTDQVQFDSVPSGAVVRTVIEPPCGDKPCDSADADGKYAAADFSSKPGPACNTPCAMTFKRGERIIATFTKAGYHPATMQILPVMAGTGALGVAGNVVVGGAVGVFTDAATGAAFDHQPNPAIATLRPAGGAAPARGR